MNDLIHLLLADDDEDDCLFFQDALDELSLSTVFTAVNDGEHLMQLLIEKGRELPSVLFLDLNMPRKNGVECLIEIKSNEILKNLPVIIYSTSFDPETINLLYKTGAQYYIRKPADFSKLKQVIALALKQIAQTIGIQPPKEEFVLQP